jgi:phosphoribosylamine--glycine ligase
MKDKLAASGYVGYIDINCIVNAKGIYPLEFTSRWGYPTISVHMEGVTSGWGDFLYHLAKHETPEFKTKKGFQIGVCIVISPYPFRDQEEADIYRDLSILFKKPNLDGFHLGDLKKINGSFAVAGTAGYIGVITGAGTTVEDARKQAYLRISNIILQNMYYRTDIGSRWMTSDSDKLLTWGYLNT